MSPFVTVAMSITNIENYFIHYEVLGRGQPVIFLHGWLGSWRYWWPAMQALSTQYRAFALDLWGYGDSSKVYTDPERATLYSFAGYTTLLDQFIAQLGIITPVTLVGHALGGIVALRYAATYPDRVNKVAAIALPMQGNSLNPRLQNLEPAIFANRILGKSQTFNEVGSELHKTDPQAMWRIANEFATMDVGEVVNKVTCPVLGIYGSKDNVVQLPQYNTQPFENGSGELHHVISLPESQHFPMLQETARFNRLLLEFLHTPAEELDKLAPKEYWQRRTR
ncbi:MAG: alpha/beta hydrolase [Anaerolineales bacterium]|nr:alpha/beta hydrolase [Anaerolineales bacterium]